ncbi:serine/threonine protein kinase [Planotetraspora sp. A-T 1434]|uniref:serine/threonine-protein kinase n=1 Tax=Planotetraspora sp. A-T 1434 TaxID=2979219 RepID=UPI0021C18FC3|nr:serine/threonine-protein kinase [Planotetraspora sp. A-T 1434]MCT9934559.1 serine/threonine protein kinase [Planotetraspora sp. A-T 1434]
MRIVADRYEITSPIGRGGMGEVWGGRDVRLNRPVAIKLISSGELASEKDARRRFNREGRITARLRHPGVPVVYDFGDDGDLYMVMESLPGETVGKLKDEQGALPVPWAAFIGAQVCAVLAAAHNADLIHRDVKPDNLVLCPDGTVKVIDFGVATSLGAGEFSKITQAGQIPGSARYMAPELIEGADASRASDLYTVGCTMYELLTGSRPFESRDLLREIARSQRESPPPMEGVPRELEELTLRLLAKAPDQRPDSAVSVYRSLLPWVRDPPPLHGWVAQDLSIDPAHMYSVVVSSLG